MNLTDDVKNLIAGNALLVALLLVLLIVLLFSCYFLGKKQGFNPTATMRATRLDGLGQGREGAAGGPAAAPAAASGPAPGSPSYNVLHSDAFACGTRDPVGDDAWSWMAAHVGGPGGAEEAIGGPVLSADRATQLLAGR